ncbi:glutamate synthase subunit beta [Pseudonocardia asaccharolytica]|uniref:Glutamate synthase n=1 Tax=Pseudonocardia asaccharolytica DSM 44247 = NBRC 16224 TaxID=1123024 RepID=A0A511D6N9_9PSEU|nr:glutamate synthase subunit beta [Pseudonocardia asaccharolytica]GEL20432.1 glutamate synthase [Pseudonocardia asaccharolytica DSM 44247 = NBRC 16224]
MRDVRGFLHTAREAPQRRPIDLRLRDWREVHRPLPDARLRQQAGRCMDCGIPFCHEGCPLGNLIPEWNDLVSRDDWYAAIERLHATNNFPEFTGVLCPAPCEDACVLAINSDPVTIKQVELQLIDHAWSRGWVTPLPPQRRTGRTVAVIGSGPAGLAAGQQLTRAGHDVVVFERADRIGGLLRYGIPEFKMEKFRLERRIEQMRAEGTVFRPGVEVGIDLTVDELRSGSDAVVLAGGATAPRELRVPGRGLSGVHLAMEYLTWANRVQEGDVAVSPITAEGRDVVIIGGGDTGTDCLGTAHRQRMRSVAHLDIRPRPPARRTEEMPWPTHPAIYRTSPAHEEGGARLFAVDTLEFHGDAQGGLRAITITEGYRDENKRFHPRIGAVEEIPAQLALLALGFLGPERGRLLADVGVDLDERGNVGRDEHFMTNVEGVFVAGDMGRGQSLIVWAIAEGRAAAAGVDAYLTGRDLLPRPILPTANPLA